MNRCDLCSTEYVYQGAQNYNPKINQDDKNIEQIKETHEIAVTLWNKSIFRVTKEGHFKGYSRYNLPMQIFIALLNRFSQDHYLRVLDKVNSACTLILNIKTDSGIMFDSRNKHLALHNTCFSQNQYVEGDVSYDKLGRVIMEKFPVNANATDKQKQDLGLVHNLAHRMVHERMTNFKAHEVGQDTVRREVWRANIMSKVTDWPGLKDTTVWNTK